MRDVQIIEAFKQGFKDATEFEIWGNLYSDACEAQRESYKRGHFAGQKEIAHQEQNRTDRIY